MVLCGVFDRGPIGGGGVAELGRGCLHCVAGVAMIVSRPLGGGPSPMAAGYR